MSSVEKSKPQIIKDLKLDEGFKDRVYKCSLGFDTIGIGYCLEKNPLNLSMFELHDMRQHGCSEAKAELLLMRMIEQIEEKLTAKIPFFVKLDEVRQNVLINMSYQMGTTGVMKFKNTLAAIEHGDYELAALGMLDSTWAKQTPNRAQRLASQMKVGA
jgi:lysozyme